MITMVMNGSMHMCGLNSNMQVGWLSLNIDYIVLICKDNNSATIDKGELSILYWIQF